jgi:hypothetical protein
MKRVCLVLVDNLPTHHSRSELRESLESVEQKCNKQKTTTSEGTGRSFREIEIESTKDDSNNDRSDP